MRTVLRRILLKHLFTVAQHEKLQYKSIIFTGLNIFLTTSTMQNFDCFSVMQRINQASDGKRVIRLIPGL
jgi:hypothetical protein